MNANVRPSIRLFSDDEISRIIEQALVVLATIGVQVESAEPRSLLQDAGALLHAGRLRIPEALVRTSLASAPERVAVYDRDGALALDLGADRVHFDPGSAALHLFDPTSRRRRTPQTRDLIDLARLVDRLPAYAAQSTAVTPSDVPQELADRQRLYLALKACSKPVVTGTFRTDGFAPMHAMLVAIRGSQEALRQKPLAIFDCCPSPPLRWSELTCHSLIACARAEIPAELISMPITAAAAPVTLREAIVQHCAENLSGIVIHQLASSGAPVIFGGAPSSFDMRNGTTPMGAMETMMLQVGYVQVGKALGLPTHGYAGVSDAKSPDYQGGMESGMGAVLASLAGVNMVSGPGMLDYLLTQSLEKLVLDHEACTMALRLARGIEQREGDAVELIGELVTAGEMLSHSHTLRNHRKELSIPPKWLDRGAYEDWEATGSRTALERARDEVERLLRQELPPLGDDQAKALDGVMAAEAARAGAGASWSAA